MNGSVDAMTEGTTSEKLPFWVKFGYGGAEFSASLMWTLFYVFFLFFLTDVVGVDPAKAGLIIAIGTVWDAIVTPMIGIYSDTRKWKRGRRRPFIFLSAVPYAITSWLLFSNFGLGATATFAFFTLAVILFFSAFSVEQVPYTSMAAEMTPSYTERTSLVTYRMGWSQVAGIIGAAAPLMLVALFARVSDSPSVQWSASAGVLALICVPPIFLTWRTSRGRELLPDETVVRWRDIWGSVVKNRPFRYTMAIFTCAIVAQNISAAIIVYFMSYNLGFSEDRASLAFLIYFAVGIVWVAPVGYLAKRWGKRWALIVFYGTWLISAGVILPFAGPGDREFVFWISVLISTIGPIAGQLLTWAMIPDTVEVDQFKTGQRREGLYFGVATFTQKVGVALAVWICGVILSGVGYVPNAEQTKGALLGIKLLCSEGTALFILITMILAYLLPMNAVKHAALREAIKKKQNGEEYEAESLEGIV